MHWWKKEITWHIIFWLGYLALRIFVIQLYTGDFLFRLQVELVELPLKMASLYFVIYILIQRFLIRRQYLQFILFLFLGLFCTMWLNRIEDYFFIHPLTQIQYVHHERGFWSFVTAFVNLIYIYPVVAIGTTIYFVRTWLVNQIIAERMSREKAELELRSLKSQLHPHFLFNTLNNMYSLALDRSDKTAEMMLRLSRLLEYMVYDAGSTKVALTKEIEAMQNYIELEKLRLGKRLELSFVTNGDVGSWQISPLLLFPFLENAFKHGSHRTSKVTWTNITLTAGQHDLVFQIENSLPDPSFEKSGNVQGIGLQNAKRRLDLLYPRHELRIHHQEDSYLVFLKIYNT